MVFTRVTDHLVDAVFFKGCNSTHAALKRAVYIRVPFVPVVLPAKTGSVERSCLPAGKTFTRHSTQQVKVSITTTSSSISRSTSSAHLITATLSRHRLPSKPSQNACVLLIQYLCPLYHVAAGLLGSLSVGSNLRPQIEA